ncbi:MAG: hypothetical protein ACHP7N_01195 [Caulobacterales bacterium]
MRKLITAGLMALNLGGSLATTAAPVQAAPHGGSWHGGGGGSWHGGGGFQGGGFRGGWRGGGWRHGDGDDGGWAIGAGIAGLALGAALADRPYYGGYYDGGYDTCVGHRRVWDPYIGRYVVRRFYYAC